MQPELIHHLLLKEVDLTNLKSGVDKLDIDKLKSLPTYLNNLKRRGDKLDFDKLVPVPVDLSKQSDVVKMLLLKRCLYGKIKNIEDKIPDITNLATTSALTTVENKILSFSNLVKKN